MRRTLGSLQLDVRRSSTSEMALCSNADASNVIAVTGLAFEARIAAGRGVNVLCATERSRLLEWLEASTAYECSGIISFGIAGGLDRRLSPGDWVVASSVVTDRIMYV